MAKKPTVYQAICLAICKYVLVYAKESAFNINMVISRHIIFVERMFFKIHCTIFFCPQANFIVVFLFLSGALVPNGTKIKASLLSCQIENTICKL